MLSKPTDQMIEKSELPSCDPVNISRRRFLMTSADVTAGALVLGFGLPVPAARGAALQSLPLVRESLRSWKYARMATFVFSALLLRGCPRAHRAPVFIR